MFRTFGMLDLTGRGDCDVYIKAELQHAGIRPITHENVMFGEVPTRVTGRLTKDGKVMFAFVRSWNYWRVSGLLPLNVAVELYDHPIGKRDILVIGDETCPHPTKWARVIQNGTYVDYYHINTLEALVLFVSALKERGLVD